MTHYALLQHPVNELNTRTRTTNHLEPLHVPYSYTLSSYLDCSCSSYNPSPSYPSERLPKVTTTILAPFCSAWCNKLRYQARIAAATSDLCQDWRSTAHDYMYLTALETPRTDVHVFHRSRTVSGLQHQLQYQQISSELRKCISFFKYKYGTLNFSICCFKNPKALYYVIE